MVQLSQDDSWAKVTFIHEDETVSGIPKIQNEGEFQNEVGSWGKLCKDLE